MLFRSQVAWWFIAFPGLALLATTLAFNLLGDALRDALDPRGERLIASMRRSGRRRPRRAASAVGDLAGSELAAGDLPGAGTELR